MKWEKLGHIFSAKGQFDWMQSHAALPFAEWLEGSLFKVYFSTRDAHNRSSIAALTLDLDQSFSIIELESTPVLSPGELGCFDDSGATGSWLVTRGSIRYLYYVGWNLGVTVPFRNSVGVAKSINGSPFERFAPGPIIDRTPQEPHFCASCCVLSDEHIWRMWYLSCVKWSNTSSGPRHEYHIKYAESKDGLNWHRDGTVAIDFEEKGEYAISRPSVLQDEDGWHMWYSHRGPSYLIGYAWSEDGIHWIRKDDEVGIIPSQRGWDCDMIEYPFVFDHNDQRYMLYNGNEYGKTGFGIARLNKIGTQ